jgi:integrase/recombinase XerD
MVFTNALKQYRKYMVNCERAAETIKGYSTELSRLNNFLSQRYNGPVYLEDITVQDLEEYLQMLKEKGNTASSRNRTVYIVRAFYNFCCKKDLTMQNLGSRLEILPEPEKERVFLSPDEMGELICAVSPPIAKVVLTTLFYTGMRISECLNLLIEDVSFNDGIITVRNTKNKKDRHIPIHKHLAPVLRHYREHIRKNTVCAYFFVSRNNNRVSPDYINRVLRETTQKLKWNKKVTCHIIRHSFASSLVSKNVNIVNIQKLLGHTSLSTTSIYTHTNISDLIKAVNTI